MLLEAEPLREDLGEDDRVLVPKEQQGVSDLDSVSGDLVVADLVLSQQIDSENVQRKTRQRRPREPQSLADQGGSRKDTRHRGYLLYELLRNPAFGRDDLELSAADDGLSARAHFCSYASGGNLQSARKGGAGRNRKHR